ncbi:MAG TPA: DUF1801 domain-containing protein [Mucilaginibacter sp.]|jgi:uncharacterized protein YdeI (YjbR/CyaY-like superfamily)|nr:DUF1801 domain-containing protein [Mucilaginibacter sp.]
MDPNVDVFLSNAKKWQEELEKLRTICLDCGLDEELKWGQPCYLFHGSNVVIIGELKDHCALSFFKGALLYDAEGILIKPGEHTQSGRWIKFSNVREIAEMEPILKAYIYEAIEVEKAGVKVTLKTTADYIIPEELQQKLDKFPPLKTAFYALTPGRQRAYILHFSQPKQSKTRAARVEKYIPLILSGKGPNDDYLSAKK